MTMSEVIAEVNVRHPNGFPEETKAKVLSTFEARIIYEFTGEEVEVEFPDYFTTELYLPDRYADVYIYYLSAMLYFWNKEYEEYNNHVGVFTNSLDTFREEFGSTRTSPHSKFFNLY